MPLDPNIPLSGVPMPDATNSLLRVTQTVDALKGMQRQHQARDIVAGAMSSGGLDLNNMNALLRQAGPAAPEVMQMVQPYIEAQRRQQQEALQMQRLQFEQQRIEDMTRRTELMADRLAMQKNNPMALLGDEAVDLAAQQYLTNGTMPSFGFGATGAAMRAKVLERAATHARAQGMEPQAIITGQMANKAKTSALSQVNRQRSLVLAFENAALANADIALTESVKTDRTGSPALNRWILAGRKSVAGDPQVAKLDFAMRTFINEYARVTSSVTGGGVTSDTARREIEDALRSAMNKEQVKQVIALAKREMENRRFGYDKQVNELTESIRPGGGSPAAPADAVPSLAPPSGGVVKWEDLK